MVNKLGWLFSLELYLGRREKTLNDDELSSDWLSATKSPKKVTWLSVISFQKRRVSHLHKLSYKSLTDIAINKLVSNKSLVRLSLRSYIQHFFAIFNTG